MNDLKLKLILEAIDKASPELKKVDGGLKKIDTAANKATPGLKKVDGGLVQVNKSASAASIAIRSFVGALSVAAIARVGKDILAAGMSWQRMENAMLAATGSVKSAASGLAFVREESYRLGLDLETAGNGFAQLSAAAKGTALSTADVQEIFKGVAETATVLGMSSYDAAGAIRAIGQIMSKGTVQAEELRGQLGERIPGAFQIAARAMGKTTQELNKMLEQGQLLSDDFLPKFAKQMREEFGDALPKATQALQAELNRLQTAWFELQVGLTDMGGMDAATEVVVGLTSAVGVLHQGLIDLDNFLSKGGLSLGGFLVALSKNAPGIREFRMLIDSLEAYQGRDMSGEKFPINRNTPGYSRFKAGAGEKPSASNAPGDSRKTSWEKEELDAYAKLGKDITDAWQQMHDDRNDVQSRSTDVQIQLEKEAADLNKIEWEATKDFWQLKEEEKWEVLSRSMDAQIALEANWQSAMIDGLDDLADYYDDTFTDRIAGTVNSAFDSMEDAMVEFAMTGKASFSDLVNSILEDLLRITIQQSITQPLAAGLSGALSGLFGGGMSTATSGLLGGSSGTPYAGELSTFFSKYHDGGKVVPRFHFGGRTDEIPAILQTGETVLDREHTRKFDAIAAALQGGGGRVIVNNYGSPDQVDVQQSNNSQGGTDLVITLERALADRMQQRGSRLSRTMETTYGLRRGGF